mgnify:CR=1 FL=1
MIESTGHSLLHKLSQSYIIILNCPEVNAERVFTLSTDSILVPVLKITAKFRGIYESFQKLTK